jgi:hypothetical protein
VLLYEGSVQEGLAMFDEAMIGVAAGQVSPPLAGEIYCTMMRRARRSGISVAPQNGPAL